MKCFTLVFVLFFSFILEAKPIDITRDNQTFTKYVEVYIDKENLSLEEVQQKVKFYFNDYEHINLGFVKDTTLWLKFEFDNSSSQKIESVLEVDNPLLESIILYDGNSSYKKGVLYLEESRKTINPTFAIRLDAWETKTYYLAVKNSTTALRLGLHIKSQLDFLEDEYRSEKLIFIFFTIVLMLFFYNASLFFYTKERLYFYYCLYIMTILFQQATYLGITQMYMPPWFIYYDNLNVLFKVNIMYITAALFAKSFLQTSNYPRLNNIYNIFIGISLIEIPLFGTPSFYYPEVGIITALIFIFFNMYAGFFIYKDGYKQARLFVIGWSFLVLGFIVMILDGLGLIAVMHNLTDLIMFLIALEAMVLSLAFIDRYIILRDEKKSADALLMQEYKSRQSIIETRITEQTKELTHALDTKQVLLKELHHRTKNNLQLILSLVRMQSDSSQTVVQSKFKDLENRISAIAKTHQILYLNDDLGSINMNEYIQELSDDLLSLTPKRVTVDIAIEDIFMHIKEASYIGLILNELITNAIKYVNIDDIFIEISIKSDNGEYRIDVKDNALSMPEDILINHGLGITLVKTLVESQLDGKLELKYEEGLHYMIEFVL